jgi:L,D-transpeptidase catalytic domain
MKRLMNRDVSRRHGLSHPPHRCAFEHRHTHVSSGCIRLTNQDVADLYSRVNVGTKVIVLPMERRADNLVSRFRSS